MPIEFQRSYFSIQGLKKPNSEPDRTTIWCKAWSVIAFWRLKQGVPFCPKRPLVSNGSREFP